MALQQLCGVNVLAYYSSPVFKDSLPNSAVLSGSETTQDNIVNMTTVNMTTVNMTTVEMRKDQVALGVGFSAEDLC